MKKSVAIYGAVVAAMAFALQWLNYQHAVRMFPTEIYVVVIALLFTVLGIWVGSRLSGRIKAPEFEPNRQALDYLGISGREAEVLELLAQGHSNKEIGEKLFVSANTVKTHLSSLYGKLQVSRRTQAVNKARELRLIR